MSKGKKKNKAWPETLPGFLENKHWSAEINMEEFSKIEHEVDRCLRSISSGMSLIKRSANDKSILLAHDWDGLSKAVDKLYDVLDIAGLKADVEYRNELVRKRVKENE